MTAETAAAAATATVHEHTFGETDCTYVELGGGRVRCLDCAHECVIAPGQTGICAVRKNEGGVLRLIVYGHANCANARDPIEKKRLLLFFSFFLS